jgi:signal transduction histidine kinase
MNTAAAASTFDHLVKVFETSNTYYLVLVDDDGNYAYLNKYFTDRYAYYYKDPSTRSALAALHIDDHALCFKTNMLCRQNPQKSYQITLRKLNGKSGYTITQWDFKANITADNRIDGIIGIGYDITDFESRQDHIRFLTSTLKDVAYKQSHLIRRPLANIVGLIELLEQGEQTAASKKIIALLKTSCDELNDEFDAFLVNDEGNLEND